MHDVEHVRSTHVDMRSSDSDKIRLLQIIVVTRGRGPKARDGTTGLDNCMRPYTVAILPLVLFIFFVYVSYIVFLVYMYRRLDVDVSIPIVFLICAPLRTGFVPRST